MEWITCLKQAVRYMEAHLLDDISIENMSEKIAGQCYMSSVYFQKGFQMITGYSMGEYVRNRRLYEAAVELTKDKTVKVIQLAEKYGYDTPESFTKAFRRFHGVTSTMARKHPKLIKQFLPLILEVKVRGGNKMDYRCERMEEFTLIGFQGIFTFPASYEEIPKFVREMEKKYFHNLWAGNPPANEYEQAVLDYNIGKHGAVIHDLGDNRFRYLLAGLYHGGPVPKGMVLHTFKGTDWVKFRGFGPNPDSILQLNTQIFREWLPGNTEFELTGFYNIEWYDETDEKAPDHISEIWIPAKRKEVPWDENWV